jgi:arylsulfatase A-like enzyme
MKHRRALGLVWVSLLFLSPPAPLPAAEQQASGTRRPNVIFILMDDMGYADVGCYGSTEVRTPHVDRLAREGVRLTQFYANAPVCTPTRAAFLTGRYQQRVGLEWALLRDQREPGLPASETSLARMLKASAYATGMVGKWHLGFKPEFGPNAHGFDEFFGVLGGSVDMYAHQGVNGERDLYENTKVVEKKGYLTDLFTDRAVAFINQHRRDPFFLYVAYNAVHFPFQPPDRPEDVRNADTWQNGTRQDYVRMLERTDEGVGRILQELDRHGLAKDTLVIFTNDNGGDRLSDNGPLFHHKATLWEGGIRVPCLLRWPGHLPANTASAQPTITMDLTAVILAATGTRPPEDRKLDGRNVLPILQGKAPAAERTFFWRIGGADRKQKAVRKGKWKYVLDGDAWTTRKELLFDLDNDAGERKDLAYRHPEVVEELRGLLANWEAELARTPPPFQVK